MGVRKPDFFDEMSLGEKINFFVSVGGFAGMLVAGTVYLTDLRYETEKAMTKTDTLEQKVDEHIKEFKDFRPTLYRMNRGEIVVPENDDTG